MPFDCQPKGELEQNCDIIGKCPIKETLSTLNTSELCTTLEGKLSARCNDKADTSTSIPWMTPGLIKKQVSAKDGRGPRKTFAYTQPNTVNRMLINCKYENDSVRVLPWIAQTPSTYKVGTTTSLQKYTQGWKEYSNNDLVRKY